MSWTVQMWGWFRADAALASRWKRSSAVLSSNCSAGRNFSATNRPRRVSFALYTTPIPPPPVHLAPVSDPHDQDQEHLVLDGVNHPVVSRADAVERLLASQFFDTR